MNGCDNAPYLHTVTFRYINNIDNKYKTNLDCLYYHIKPCPKAFSFRNINKKETIVISYKDTFWIYQFISSKIICFSTDNEHIILVGYTRDCLFCDNLTLATTEQARDKFQFLPNLFSIIPLFHFLCRFFVKYVWYVYKSITSPLAILLIYFKSLADILFGFFQIPPHLHLSREECLQAPSLIKEGWGGFAYKQKKRNLFQISGWCSLWLFPNPSSPPFIKGGMSTCSLLDKGGLGWICL